MKLRDSLAENKSIRLQAEAETWQDAVKIGVDLLVAADCTALAYAGLQKDFLAGRVVMMGCPKFDDQQLYVDRFTEIFRTRALKSLTILIMEVPCCHAMLQIIKQAVDAAKPAFPIRHVVVSTRGEIKAETAW